VGLTGATGHIGSVLLGRLLGSEEVEVRSLARRPLGTDVEGEARRRPLGKGRPRLVHTCADIRDARARRALEGADLVFHLAAQVWRGHGPMSLAEMRSVNLGGTDNVIAARPTAVVLASSAAVYGAWPDNPLPLSETDLPRPNAQCPYAEHKLAAEHACSQRAER
jgi:UDP-glucose 4-epimerase